MSLELGDLDKAVAAYWAARVRRSWVRPARPVADADLPRTDPLYSDDNDKGDDENDDS